MKRGIRSSALVLFAALLLGMTGCAGEQGIEYEERGRKLTLPRAAQEILTVMPVTVEENESMLFVVYETTSYEEYLADYGSAGMGLLFGIGRMTQEEHETFLQFEDTFGVACFAKDDTYFYLLRRPTDVQFYRSAIEDYSYDVFGPWEEAYTYMDGMLEEFISDNGLTAHTDAM